MEPSRFHQLRALMNEAFRNNQLDQASGLAQEYLQLAAVNRQDWNYGNAVHHAHITLGKIAILQGNISIAKEHLISAGQSPGSPQLNSFGPNMSLALELLKLNERDVVLEFIDLTTQFWKKLFSFFRVRRWKKSIQQGEIPDFKAHLFY